MISYFCLQQLIMRHTAATFPGLGPKLEEEVSSSNRAPLLPDAPHPVLNETESTGAKLPTAGKAMSTIEAVAARRSEGIDHQLDNLLTMLAARTDHELGARITDVAYGEAEDVLGADVGFALGLTHTNLIRETRDGLRQDNLEPGKVLNVAFSLHAFLEKIKHGVLPNQMLLWELSHVRTYKEILPLGLQAFGTLLRKMLQAEWQLNKTVRKTIYELIDRNAKILSLIRKDLIPKDTDFTVDLERGALEIFILTGAIKDKLEEMEDVNGRGITTVASTPGF